MLLEDDGGRNSTRGDEAESEEAVLQVVIRSINHAPLFSISNHSVFYTVENSGNVAFSPFAHVISLGGEDEQDQAFSFQVISVASVDSMWPAQVPPAVLLPSTLQILQYAASDVCRTCCVCRISSR